MHLTHVTNLIHFKWGSRVNKGEPTSGNELLIYSNISKSVVFDFLRKCPTMNYNLLKGFFACPESNVF